MSMLFRPVAPIMRTRIVFSSVALIVFDHMVRRNMPRFGFWAPSGFTFIKCSRVGAALFPPKDMLAFATFTEAPTATELGFGRAEVSAGPPAFFGIGRGNFAVDDVSSDFVTSVRYKDL